MRYHHIGIPTAESRTGEIDDPGLKLSRVSGNSNAYGVEWTRFHDDCDYPTMVRECAHVAFETADLDGDLEGEHVIVEPHETSTGVVSAYIDVLGAPVRLMRIDQAVAGNDAVNPVEASGKQLSYHHTGLPCDRSFRNEIKVPHLRLAYLPGKHNRFGAEWIRFEEGNENPEIIKRIAHVAFEVDDVDQAIVGEKVIYHSGRGTPGIVVAMIDVDGAPVEFIELDRKIVGDEYDAFSDDVREGGLGSAGGTTDHQVQ